MLLCLISGPYKWMNEIHELDDIHALARNRSAWGSCRSGSAWRGPLACPVFGFCLNGENRGYPTKPYKFTKPCKLQNRVNKSRRSTQLRAWKKVIGMCFFCCVLLRGVFCCVLLRGAGHVPHERVGFEASNG